MMLSQQLDNRSRTGTVAPAPQVRRLGRFLTVASVILIFAATLSPQSGHPEGSPWCILCGSLGGVDAVLNVLLFLPLGIGLALTGTRLSRALLAILILSTTIELAQFFVVSGRDAALGDVLSNLVGGAIGFVLARRFDSWVNPSRRGASALAAAWIVAWLAMQLLVSYSFAPALPSTRYYGQIARVFENMATFGGRVLSATIDTVSVPDFGFSKTEQFHHLLQNGAVVRAVVIPAGPTPRVAPILRIADQKQRQIVLLGQDRADVVFGVYTGATNLKLRPPLFRLDRVFPGERGAAGSWMSDTLDLRASYHATGVDIEAGPGGSAPGRHYPVSSALGWILFLPLQWYIEGTRAELLLSFLWLAALLFPLGYWVFLAARPRPGLHSRFVPAFGALAVVLFVGLIVVPRSFGLNPASVGAWLAAMVGLASGGALAQAKQLSPARLSSKPDQDVRA